MRTIDADAFEADCRKRYCTGCENYNGIKCKSCWVDDMLGEVEKAPTLSPDEVRGVGEWIEKEVYNLEVATIEQMQSARCSSCGKYHTTPFSYYFDNFNYCPNCGARMKGAEDGTTDMER